MFKTHPKVQAALQQRNTFLSEFWFSEPTQRTCLEPVFTQLKTLIIDAEDTFTIMLAQQLSAIGLRVTARGYNESGLLDDNWDLIVMGPGPGDPRDRSDQRIVCMQTIMAQLLFEQRPFLAVCLSHQILCLELGIPLVRRDFPNQGVQRDIDLFGIQEKVGFYNTYVAKYNSIGIKKPNFNATQISWDEETGDIHALRGPYYASFQFHPESLLTTHGIRILSSGIKSVLKI